MFDRKEYYKNNRDKIIEREKRYVANNREKVAERRKKQYERDKEKIKNSRKIWRENNKEKIKQLRKEYNEKHKKEIARKRAEKEKKNPIIMLRKRVSVYIRNTLVRNLGSKNGDSFLKYVPYTVKQLKEHLESQFEPWMNWSNNKPYNPKIWNDNDPSTWAWNIDHIIPVSDLPYDSMSHPNFQKCWSLENLRPYSAKQNILDGANKIRHKK